MTKIKTWEIVVLVIIVLLAYFISLYVASQEAVDDSGIKIPEGASDDYIIEQAYQNVDNTICELIEDEIAREECLKRVEDKIFLEEGIEKAKEEIGGASAEDRKLLAKALLNKDESFCDSIVDVATKQKCFDSV